MIGRSQWLSNKINFNDSKHEKRIIKKNFFTPYTISIEKNEGGFVSEIISILRATLQKPIAFHRINAKITGSITTGLLLSQLWYWWNAVGNREFFKTDSELMDETCLGKHEFAKAKNELKRLGIIEAKVKGVPAKTFYSINEETYLKLIKLNPKTSFPKTGKLESPKAGNQFPENGKTNTENTTENTIPPIISPEGGESVGDFKDEEGITETPSKESFETFWSIYPRKIGKENAYKQFEANLRKKHNFEEMLNSAKLYGAYCQQRQLEPSYIKTPAAFLKNIWNDEGSLKEWELSLSKHEDTKIPFSRMPTDAAQRLRKLIATKQLLDEHGNPITERTGFVEEFLNTGFWGALPGFVQKSIVEFQPSVEMNEVPEPNGWREHLEQNYDAENEKIQKYILKGWKSIPEWLQRDIVFEMEQK